MSSQQFQDQTVQPGPAGDDELDDYYDPDEFYGPGGQLGSATLSQGAPVTIPLARDREHGDEPDKDEAQAGPPASAHDETQAPAFAQAPPSDAAGAPAFAHVEATPAGTKVDARRMSLLRARWIWVGAGIIVALIVLSRLITPAPGGGQPAIDNTGASRGQTGAGRGAAIAPPRAATPAPTRSTGQIPATSLTSGPLILVNPGVVRQGSSITVTGSGFDARAIVDLSVRQVGSAQALASTFVQADKNGAFGGVTLTVPTTLPAGSFSVNAQERNGGQTAHAVATVAGGAPVVKLGTQVGKPGDTIALTLTGFAPGEAIHVFWNSLNTDAVATVQANGSGGVGPTSLQVPFGAVGTNTFLFVGARSQSLVAADFLVLSLYPSVTLSTYALQADNAISFTGDGFGPGERVLVYLNNPNDAPIAVLQSDRSGAFKNAGNVLIPFGVKGQETLIFLGEQSRAPDAVSFTILPYSPVVQPSTYGGFPGTTVAFYASAFARNEVVRVYAGHIKSEQGTLVSCFQTDDHGSAAAAGSYLIPGNAQVGSLGFALVGEKSGGVGLTSVNVSAAPSPVQTPPQPPFTCSLDQTQQSQQTQQTQQSQQTAAPGSAATPAVPATQGLTRNNDGLASISTPLALAVAQRRPQTHAPGFMRAVSGGVLVVALSALLALVYLSRSRRTERTERIECAEREEG